MFTGIVRATGRIVERRAGGEGIVFRVEAPEIADRLGPGDSIAVDGVCQTVTASRAPEIEFHAVRTTLSRTTLGSWEPGRQVNLEPPLAAGDALGGHLVQGHVDGVAPVLEVEPAGETVFLRIRLPREVARVTVLHGSLAVDGVSLTVNALDADVAELAIIPYTWTRTALSRLRVGDGVNVEADLIGKYVRKLVEPYGREPRAPGPERTGSAPSEPDGAREPSTRTSDR